MAARISAILSQTLFTPAASLRLIAHAGDMHEVHPRLIEEEVIVKRRHFETAVERRAHHRVDLILEEDRVAHHHRPPWEEGVNAAQEPSPMKGGMDQPST